MSGEGVAKRLVRIGAVAAGLVLCGTLLWLAPRGLRRVDAFRVQRVEVSGTRYVEPYTVVRAAGIDSASNVFDDADAWREGLLRLPLVRDARIRRRLPGTVVLEVREVAPVALVAANELMAVDAGGRILELDPAGMSLDLPILRGVTIADGHLVGAQDTAAVAALNWLEQHAPEFANHVSMIELRPGALRVLFRGERAEALLPLVPSEAQLNQLRLAYADLVARGDLQGVRRIDVRFRDQVVVSFLSSPVS